MKTLVRVVLVTVLLSVVMTLVVVDCGRMVKAGGKAEGPAFGGWVDLCTGGCAGYSLRRTEVPGGWVYASTGGGGFAMVYVPNGVDGK